MQVCQHRRKSLQLHHQHLQGVLHNQKSWYQLWDVHDTNLLTIWKSHISYPDSDIGDFASVEMRGELTNLVEMQTCWRGAEAVGYERFAGRDSPIGHGERGGEGRRPSIVGCSQHCPMEHAGVRLHLLRFIGFSRRRRSPVLWIHQSGCGRDLC
jgi:hypothetical protein